MRDDKISDCRDFDVRELQENLTGSLKEMGIA